MAVVAIPLGALLIASCVLILNAGYRQTLGLALQDIADRVRRVSIGTWKATIHFGWLADKIDDANAFVEHALGQAVYYTSWPLIRLLEGLRRVFLAPAEQLDGLAQDVLTALRRGFKFTVPGMIAAATAWWFRKVIALNGQVQSLVRRAPVHIVHEIVKAAKPAAAVIVHEAIAVPWPRIKRAERDVAGAWKRIRSLARRVAPAAIAAAVVAAIARMGLGWARCSRVRKVGRRLCGIPDGLLDALLADTLLLASGFSIVLLAEAALAAEDEIVAGVQRGVKELRGVAPAVTGGYSGRLG